MADLDLKWVAKRAEALGYAPVYVALIRSLRVVQRSPLILAGPAHALELGRISAMDERSPGAMSETEASGQHGWWLRRELPMLLGEACEFKPDAAISPR